MTTAAVVHQEISPDLNMWHLRSLSVLALPLLAVATPARFHPRAVVDCCPTSIDVRMIIPRMVIC